MRRIAVFTGTRAEYDLLRPVLLHMRVDHSVEPVVIVSGTHLLTAYGRTADAIYADGFSHIDVPLFEENKEIPALYKTMSSALELYGEVLEGLRPELALVLGDRYETFCFALCALTRLVPLAHVHGGELTLGAMDDVFRHCITKMSLLHFTSCEEHRARVIQLGEDPGRVWNFGAPGVENALNLELPSAESVRKELGIRPEHPFFLCALHPVTLRPGSALASAHAVLKALDAFPEYDAVFTASNADPEGRDITSLFQQDARRCPRSRHFFPSLGAVRYLGAAKHSCAVVGNSSSGIIEIPSLGVPVVDIGARQAGRVRSEAIIHCEPTEEEILAALRRALSPEGRQQAMTAFNPYEGKDTAKRIAEILCRHPLDSGMEKTFFDMPKMQESIR